MMESNGTKRLDASLLPAALSALLPSVTRYLAPLPCFRGPLRIHRSLSWRWAECDTEESEGGGGREGGRRYAKQGPR